VQAEPGYVAAPAGGGPGVLVLHAWWGLSDGIRRFCDRLAGEGFVGLAPDLCGGQTAATIAEAEALVEGLDDDTAIARAAAGIARLRAHPAVRGQLGVIGFSMGVWFSLDLAAKHDDVEAVVLYYGTASGIDHGRQRASVLGHFAERDDFEPADEVSSLEHELRQAGRAVRFHVYPGVGHWFAETDRPEAHDLPAASLAFRRTVGFLRCQLQKEAVAPLGQG
jgi:carboxymethylenebutenolidase